MHSCLVFAVDLDEWQLYRLELFKNFVIKGVKSHDVITWGHELTFQGDEVGAWSDVNCGFLIHWHTAHHDL